MFSMFCSECGKRIEFDETREYGFCSYCGSRIDIKEYLSKTQAGQDVTSRTSGLSTGLPSTDLSMPTIPTQRRFGYIIVESPLAPAKCNGKFEYFGVKVGDSSIILKLSDSKRVPVYDGQQEVEVRQLNHTLFSTSIIKCTSTLSLHDGSRIVICTDNGVLSVRAE